MDIEDSPKREPIRPHHLGWSAKYCDRYACSANKFASDRGHRRRAARQRTIERGK